MPALREGSYVAVLLANSGCHRVGFGLCPDHGCEMKTWELKRTTQCAKCPWRKDVDPHEIPNGYSEDKHRALSCTIAKEGDLSFLQAGSMRVMACHETHDAHCLGWLMHQLGPGNNIGLRLAMRTCENASDIKLQGEQHATFEDTLPE